MTNSRNQVQMIFEKACALIRQEKEIAYESLVLVGKLKEYNAAVNLGLSEEEFLQKLGLSKDMYYKRWQACRVITFFPILGDMLRNGETFIAQLALVSPKITAANQHLVVEGIRGKSKREVQQFLATVTPDGRQLEAEARMEITLTLTASELALLSRAQDVLSSRGKNVTEKEVVMNALQVLLDKKDPLRKAARVLGKEEASMSAPAQTPEAGATSSGSTVPGQSLANIDLQTPCPAPGRKTIPSFIRHQVWLRDEGRCAYVAVSGQRCSEMRMIEIDHILPLARGGQDTLDNLRLLCRYHNQCAADQAFGRSWMEQYRGVKALLLTVLPSLET